MPTPLPTPRNSASSSNPDLIVRGQRVVTPGGEIPAAIHIRNGVIMALSAFEDIPTGSAVHAARDSVLMAGPVGAHVHIPDPGGAEWQVFPTAARAAAAGGVTTLVEMPLNSL